MDVLLASDHLAVFKERLDEDRSIGAARGKLYRISQEDFQAGETRPGGTLDSAGHVIRRTRMVYDRG